MRDNRGTSPRSDKAAHVIGTSGGRPCASAWLARSMSTTMVIGKAPEVAAEPARETAATKERSAANLEQSELDYSKLG